jgi:hypothetical protein
MTYVVDANVLIQARQHHYAFDFCPAFWSWLERENGKGNVFSVERVGKEVTVGTDPLAVWARKQGPAFFLPPTSDVVASIGSLSQWAQKSKHGRGGVSQFLNSGDLHLIAHAQASKCTVVTHETRDPDLRWIKIPGACDSNGVAVCGPYAMLRKLGAKFVLNP